MNELAELKSWSGEFLRTDSESAFLNSIRESRKRFVVFFCLFGGVLFSITSFADLLELGATQQALGLISARFSATGICLLVAYSIHRSDSDRSIDILLLLAMLSISIVLAMVPVIRSDQNVHELVVILMICMFYLFMPVRIHLLVINGTVAALILLLTLSIYQHSDISSMTGLIILLLLANGVGFAAARWRAMTSRHHFWSAQLLASEIEHRKKIAQKLEQSEKDLLTQVEILRRQEEQLQIQQIELLNNSRQLTEAKILAESSNSILNEAVESIANGFVLFDKDLKLIACNSRYRELYDYDESECMPGTPASYLAGLDQRRKTVMETDEENLRLYGRLKAFVSDEQKIVIRLKDGRWLQISDRRTASGNIVSIQADVTELKEAEHKIRHMANHDWLTGLPSLRLAMDRIDMAIAGATRDQTNAVLMFIDLDGFKQINDQFGHAVGDQVLKTTASRLNQSIRNKDTAARIGGDEFLVLLVDISEAGQANLVAEKLLRTIQDQIQVNDIQIQISASIGIALFPKDDMNRETLIRLADNAMYKAKELGKNQIHFHQAGLTG